MHFVAHLFDDEIDFPWRAAGYGGAVVTNELKLMRRRLWQITAEKLRRARSATGSAEKLNRYGDAAATTLRLATHRALQRLLRWPGGVHYYRDAMLFFKSEEALRQGCYPSLVPGWDNTPRAGPKGIVLHGTTPGMFAQHMGEILDAVADRPAEDRLVFIKSWNEWAEGNYLEPDRKFGHAYLDAVRTAMGLNAASGS